MVKPNIKGKVSAVKGISMQDRRETMFNKMATDKKFQESALLNTANRWATKYSFSGDLTYKGVSETKKSFKLAVDGKELQSKYVLTGTVQKPFLISGRAIAMASRK